MGEEWVLGRMREILKMFPNILLSSESKEEKIKKVSSVPGLGTKTAASFVNYIPEFLEFIKETKLEYKLQTKKPAKVDTKSHPLYEKRIVFSGFRDKDLSNSLTKLGANISTSVSKKTFVVLVQDKDEDTGKAETARELKIPIMTPKEFIKKYL